MDPIKQAWREVEHEISWKEYLENRNNSSRELGYKDAYDEYYSNKKRANS